MNSNHTVHAHGFVVSETKGTVHGTHSTIHIFKNYFSQFLLRLGMLFP